MMITSTIEMAQPATIGIFSRRLSAIAVPITCSSVSKCSTTTPHASPLTSAISVAIIAASANRYRMIFSHHGQCALTFCARSIPVTDPSLMHNDWRKIAMIFDTNTMTRSWYL